MPQYFLTVPHDDAEEPTMESMQEMGPADLQAMIAAVERFNTALNDADSFVPGDIGAGGLTTRPRPFRREC